MDGSGAEKRLLCRAVQLVASRCTSYAIQAPKLTASSLENEEKKNTLPEMPHTVPSSHCPLAHNINYAKVHHILHFAGWNILWVSFRTLRSTLVFVNYPLEISMDLISIPHVVMNIGIWFQEISKSTTKAMRRSLPR